VVRNLVAIKQVPKDKFGKNCGQTVNLPGQTVKVGQILDALQEVGGREALDLVEEKPDPGIEAIVASLPARFDISLANTLGMTQGIGLGEEVKGFARTLGSDV
jgi:nucleoside-diphosphate-sugar epimerase